LVNLQALDFLHDILQEIHLHMMDVAGYDCCSGQRVAIDIAGDRPSKQLNMGLVVKPTHGR